MATYPQNSLVDITNPLNAIDATVDGSSSSEVIDVYLDFKNLSSVPVYKGGSGWAEYAVYGFGGNDKIYASHGDDNIYGGSGNDTVQSYYGLNFIDGGTGRDTLDYSWFGNDTSLNIVSGVDADLAIRHTFELDGVAGLRFDDEFTSIENLRGSKFNDELYGNSISNTISGGSGNDLVFGRAGVDRLWGNNGDDKLNGGTGNDVLTGGLGADDLTGDDGADRFVFTSVADSTSQLVEQDLITDFSSAEGDVMDLRALTSTAIDFIGMSAFSGDGPSVPEVRYFHSAGATVVQVDTNGNGVTNLEVTLSGILTLHNYDFML